MSEKVVPLPEVYFKGSCACGRLTYECTSEPGYTTACHCVTCQKLSGGPYQAFTAILSKQVTFFDNREHLKYEGLPKDSIGGIVYLHLSKIADRAFCGSCFSSLAMRYVHNSESVYITLGTVNESSIKEQRVKEALSIDAHIFTSQRACWAGIADDGKPRLERFGGSFEKDMEDWHDKTKRM